MGLQGCEIEAARDVGCKSDQGKNAQNAIIFFLCVSLGRNKGKKY